MSAVAALQDLIHATLIASPIVSAHVGVRVYDNPPVQPSYPYISFGPSYTNDARAECINAELITLQVDVWTSEGGDKRRCRVVADAVRWVMNDADLVLPDPYALAQLRVPQVRVFGDPEPGIAHGVVEVEAMVEALSWPN